MGSKLLVTKDNQLINASYTLSLSEQRVILLCIAKLDSRKKITADHEFVITVDDLHSELGISRENAYRDLRNAVNNLYCRTIKLDPNDLDTEMRWLYKKAHFKSEGTVILYFSPSIIPYISELKEKFTSYKLKDVAHFKSSYSFRFYEALAQWKFKNELKVEVSWIRDILQLGGKYPKISDLKKYVVVPALNDINKFSNLNIKLSQVKQGKEVTHFVFNYFLKCGEIETKRITREYIEKHARPGESWEEARTRLAKLVKEKNSEIDAGQDLQA
jgi:plasmid replication initiation protein